MAPRPKDYIAARAQGRRRELGLSKAEVAEEMCARGHEWTETTVTGVENSRKSRWTLPEMWDYAQVLDMEVLDLFPLDRLDDATIRRAIPGYLRTPREGLLAAA